MAEQIDGGRAEVFRELPGCKKQNKQEKKQNRKQKKTKQKAVEPPIPKR